MIKQGENNTYFIRMKVDFDVKYNDDCNTLFPQRSVNKTRTYIKHFNYVTPMITVMTYGITIYTSR